MKDMLIEIKNNLQGNNSRVDEAENKINNLEHNNKKKKEPPQIRVVLATSGTTSRGPRFTS